jgi:hypothetical protein
MNVTIAIPAVSEADLARMHAANQKLDKPASDPTALPKEKKPEPVEPNSLFSGPDPVEAAQAKPVENPQPVVEQPKPVAPPVEEPKPVPAAAPVASSTPAPAPAQPGGAMPGPDEYKQYIAKCFDIARNQLPKAGEKNGGAMLRDFLLKGTGKTQVEKLTRAEWAAGFAKLDGSPAEMLGIIKSAVLGGAR